MANTKEIIKNEYTILSLLWIFSILIRGYKYGTSNHLYYLPEIFKYNNQSLYTKDIIFNYPTSNSFFFKILGNLSLYINLEILMFILYLIFSFLFVLAIFKITKLIFNNKYIGYIAVLLLITTKPALGTEQTFRVMTFPITISIVLILFSVYYLLKEKYMLSFILLGISYNIHGLSSSHIFGAYIIYFLLRFKNINKKRFILGIILFLLLIAPLLYLSKETTSMSFYNADKEWLKTLKEIDMSHSFPSNWSFDQYKLTSPILALSLLAFIFLLRKKPEDFKYHKIVMLAKSIIFLMILGLVFAELYPIEIIIILQLIRSSLFLIIFGLIYTAFMIHTLINSKEHAKKVIGITLFSSLFFYDYISLAIILPIIMLTTFCDNIKKYKKFIIAYLILIMLSALFIPNNILIKIFDHIKLNLIILISSIILYTIYTKYKNINLEKFLIISLIIMLILASFLSIYSTNSFKKHMQFPKKIEKTNSLDMEQWINRNTPKDSLILIPPYLSTFRMNTQRSVFFDYISTGPVYFSKNFAEEWKIRMNKLGITSLNWDKNYTNNIYNKINQDKIEILKREYGITHAVFKKEKELDYKIVYDNKEYIIYEL